MPSGCAICLSNGMTKVFLSELGVIGENVQNSVETLKN